MMKRLFLVATLATILSVGSASASVVFTDDFESNSLGLDLTPNGWTQGVGSEDVIGTGFYQWYGLGRYIDMNGSTGQAGAISQLISGLTAGAKYLLSFDVGYNNGSGNNEALGYGIGSLNTSYGPPILSGSGTFLHITAMFTASAMTELLHFADVGNSPGDNGGPILDNVMIQTAAVPVPAAGALLLAGLGGLAALRRRKTV